MTVVMVMASRIAMQCVCCFVRTYIRSVSRQCLERCPSAKLRPTSVTTAHNHTQHNSHFSSIPHTWTFGGTTLQSHSRSMRQALRTYYVYMSLAMRARRRRRCCRASSSAAKATPKISSGTTWVVIRPKTSVGEQHRDVPEWVRCVGLHS